MSSRHVRPAERAAMQQCLTAAAPYRQLHAEQTISSWNEGSKGTKLTLVAWLWNLQAYNPVQLIFNFAYIQRLYFYSDSNEGHSLKGLCSELARTYQMLHRGTFKTGLSLNTLLLHTECLLSPIMMHRYKTNLTWASCIHPIFLELTRIPTRLPKLLLPVNKKHIPKAGRNWSGIRLWSICLCMKLKARVSIK